MAGQAPRKRKTLSDYQRVHRARLVGRTHDLFRRAKAYHWQHGAILEHRTDEIFGDHWYRKLTIADREYLRAVWDTLSDLQWQRDLVWRLGPAEGPVPEDQHDAGWQEGGIFTILCRQPGKLYGAHFWRGTDLPFNSYACTNPDRTVDAGAVQAPAEVQP